MKQQEIQAQVETLKTKGERVHLTFEGNPKVYEIKLRKLRPKDYHITENSTREGLPGMIFFGMNDFSAHASSAAEAAKIVADQVAAVAQTQNSEKQEAGQ